MRFKSKITRGFSFSPLRDSSVRGSLVEKNQEKPLGPGYYFSNVYFKMGK